MRRVSFLVCVIVSLAQSAAALAVESDGSTPQGGGAVVGSTIIVGIIGPGSSGADGYISAGDPNGPRPYTYTWVPFGAGSFGPVSDPCDAGFGTPGTPWLLVVRDLSGAIVSQEARCLPQGTAPPAVEPAPTIGEIWDAAMRDIPSPRAGINPRPTGLTGLETWLWYDGAREIDVSASIRGWTVTGAAHLVEVTFEMGDGHSVTSHTFGSEAEPAARYVYETKGRYDVVVTVRWEADVVLSGPGVLGRPTPIGAAVLRSSEPYPVQEVRGLLVE